MTKDEKDDLLYALDVALNSAFGCLLNCKKRKEMDAVNRCINALTRNSRNIANLKIEEEKK